MSIGSFFKKLPGRVWKGAKVGVPLVAMLGIPIPAIGIIKAAMAIAEQRGGRGKAEVALDELLPALQREGIKLPTRKIKMIMELLLDDDTNDLPGEDAVLTFDVKEEARRLSAGN